MADKRKIEVTFDANVDKFSRDVNKATGDLNQFSQQANRHSVNIKRSFAGIGTALAGIVSVGALGALTKSALDTADAIGKASERTGFTVQALQELRFAGDQTGVSIGEMDNALARFTKRLGLARLGTGAAAKTYEQLGIDLSRTNNEVFRDVVRRLGDMDDATDRLALTTRLFGDDAQSLALTFKDGVAGIDAFARQARELGLILDDDLVKGAEAANDQLSIMRQVLDVQFTRTFAELAPLIVDLGNAFASAAKQVGEFYRNIKNNAANAESEKMLGFLDTTRDRIAALQKQLNEGGLNQGQSVELDALIKLEKQLEEQHRKLIKARIENEKAANSAQVLSTGKKTTSTIKTDGKSTKLPTANPPKREQVAEYKDPIDDFINSLYKYREELDLVNPKMERLGVLFAEGAIPVEVYKEGLRRLGQETESVLDELPDDIEEVNEAWKELGLTFTSAFEDAIVEGRELSEVLKGLEQDIIRIISRKLVTEPLGNAVSDLFSGGDFFGDIFGSIFGGGRAIGGPVLANTPYLVGERGPELFVPGSNGSITPNNKLGGATVVVNINSIPPGGNPEAYRLSARQGALEAARVLNRSRSIS